GEADIALPLAAAVAAAATAAWMQRAGPGSQDPASAARGEDAVEARDWFEEELRDFDGASGSGPILLAADGLVFNVASARNLYGPGGKYAALAGRDASRLLGKNSLEEEDEASRQMPLNLAERAFLSAWVMSFKNKYPLVGRLKEEEEEEATPASLIKAAERGDLGRLRRQLKQGADITWADADGLTALHWAARSGKDAVVELLLSTGADAEGRDKKGRTSLHWAATMGQAAVAEKLLEATDPEAEAADAWLPLHFAAQGGHVEVIQALLRRGADVNRTSRAGVTALMGAARSGHLEATRVLLEAGASTGVKANGKTAQQWAANQGLNDIADLIASFET
ncbi:Kidins220, partial [Symbiodinium necroappetens]